VASLLIPGLGQLLARQMTRGLLLLGSFITSAGLFIWRVNLLAPRETGLLARLWRALERRPFFVIPVLIAYIVLWLWTAWDAYLQAHPRRRTGIGVFSVVMLLFLALGWHVSEIDLYKFFSELGDAGPRMTQIMWPWEKAVTRDTAMTVAGAEILSPCDELPPPEPPAEVAGEPYVVADPTCGDLTTTGDDLEQVPGTLLSFAGRGFAPNTETLIFWVDPLGNEFQMRSEGQYLSVMTDDEGAFQLEVHMPYRVIPPSAEGRQFNEIQARQISVVGNLEPSQELKDCTEGIVETIIMGLMATIFGILFSIPVSFLAARNLMSGSSFTMAVYYIVRTILNIVRSIEPLIWVLIAVVIVGLGPFAGIISLTVHSIAALGKLYSEAIENIDPGPIEAIQATGATRLQTIMYAVVPQMIPPFVSFSIYRWDINVRMSTIIGLVGGGGIGLVLIQYMRVLDFRAAGIAVWFIAITVATLDYVSAEIRQRFV
jgi:phosphonate transport system permease protein